MGVKSALFYWHFFDFSGPNFHMCLLNVSLTSVIPSLPISPKPISLSNIPKALSNLETGDPLFGRPRNRTASG